MPPGRNKKCSLKKQPPPPWPHPQKKRQIKVKFKETKLILKVRSGKIEPSTESRRNVGFCPLHSKDQKAQ